MATTCNLATEQHKEYHAGQHRTQPLEVLSLGLMRTGTSSMSHALEILGYQHTAHGLDLLDQPDYVNKWHAAANAKYNNIGPQFTRTDWDELLGHCSATTDLPCAMFWRELCEAYPEAKVILVQRDEDKWYRSFCDAVVASLFSRAGRFNSAVIEPLLGTKLSSLVHMLQSNMFGADDAEGMKRNARAVYRKHYADVRETIPKERRLDYELGSGWEPLCEFLGKPVPKDVEFPHVNETAELHKKVEQYTAKLRGQMGQAMVRVFSIGFPIVVGTGVALWNLYTN